MVALYVRLSLIHTLPSAHSCLPHLPHPPNPPPNTPTQTHSDAELAQRRGDFAKAGELVHAVIPDLERRANAGKGGSGKW